MLPITTRFPNGATNVAETDPMCDFKAPSPVKYAMFFDDFFTFTVAQWTVNETQAGATQVPGNGDGGVLSMVNTAANNDLNSIQLTTTVLTLDPSKDAVVKCRAKLDDATLGVLLIGLAVVDASPIASLPTDGAWFYKAAAATTVAFNVSKTSVVSSVKVGSMANDTFVDMTAQWNSASVEWLVYFNGAAAGRIAGSTNFPLVPLTVTIALANGSGVARTMTTDYVLCAKER